MWSELSVLLLTAITVSFLHTLAGPDHYLPFIALSKARSWTLKRTLFWTAICGCGHVLSSVVLGLGGATLGWSLSKITGLQNLRGGLAGWALLCFGALYFIWGVVRAGQNRRHKHFDIEGNEVYVFEHRHGEIVQFKERHAVTPWVLFLIFLLGPCEPMIPLLFFPAAQNSMPAMFLLIATYTFFTVTAMLLMVVLSFYGLSFLQSEKWERHLHTLGGAAVFICGAGMVWLGW